MAQVVRIVSGGVIDEVTRHFLGRLPQGRDGTWLMEVHDDGGYVFTPIAAEGTWIIRVKELKDVRP